MTTLVSVLESELERRCSRNPKYSLRAFARAINLSPASLSLILSGKRNLSPRRGKEVLNYLNLSEDLKDRLVKSLETGEPIDEFEVISHEQFEWIADWYHYAILSLLEIPGSTDSAQWLAEQLNISEICAELSVKRLKKMGIIGFENGRWKQTSKPISIDRSKYTDATKNFQKQLLDLVKYAIDQDPYETREIGSMTLAVAEEDFKSIQEEIKLFRRSLARKYEKKSVPNRVYNFTMQFVPVSKKVTEDARERVSEGIYDISVGENQLAN